MVSLEGKINQLGLQQRRPPLLVLVVLPDSAAAQRKAVKAWGDVKRGVATQCVVGVGPSRMGDATEKRLENHEV